MCKISLDQDLVHGLQQGKDILSRIVSLAQFLDGAFATMRLLFHQSTRDGIDHRIDEIVQEFVMASGDLKVAVFFQVQDLVSNGVVSSRVS